MNSGVVLEGSWGITSHALGPGPVAKKANLVQDSANCGTKAVDKNLVTCPVLRMVEILL